jgi:SAM-dependent methyltransferase
MTVVALVTVVWVEVAGCAFLSDCASARPRTAGESAGDRAPVTDDGVFGCPLFGCPLFGCPLGNQSRACSDVMRWVSRWLKFIGSPGRNIRQLRRCESKLLSGLSSPPLRKRVGTSTVTIFGRQARRNGFLHSHFTGTLHHLQILAADAAEAEPAGDIGSLVPVGADARANPNDTLAWLAGGARANPNDSLAWLAGGARARIAGVIAASEWAQVLGEWAIPEEIIASAPEPPWGFPVDVFVDHAQRTVDEGWSPTHQRVADVLPDGGILLDVGCGAGAASLPLAPPAARMVAVDEDIGMLDALAKLANGRVEVELIAGRWPEVAGRVAGADVAVCANVLYNVADVTPFLVALTEVASRRVVLELSEVHPQVSLSPLWRHFWGLARPNGPTADDAEAVVREVLGVAPGVERWARSRSYLGERGPETVAWLRRRLCLTSASDDEIAGLLPQLPELAPTGSVTLWWPARGPRDRGR